MSLLDNFKEASPEGICQRMDQYTFKTTEYINLINNFSELSVEQKKYICEYMENFNTFYLYVRELIEPIAYTTLDNVKLIRKDNFDRFKKIALFLQEIATSDFHYTKKRLQESSAINDQRVSLIDELEKMNTDFRHPYQ